MWRNNITRISTAAATIVVALFVYVVAPKAYSLLTNYEEKVYTLDFELKWQIINFFTVDQAIDDIKSEAGKSVGFLEISEDNTNIRTSINLDSDANIAWVANEGDRYSFYEVGDLNGRPWYRILRPGTISDYYWVSGVVVNVIASQEDAELSDFGVEVAKKTTDDYFEAKKKAYKEQEFTHFAPQLLEGTALYNREKKYIEQDKTNKIQTKLLTYELLDSIYVNEDYTFVRVAEAYELKDEHGNIYNRYLLREYFLRINAASKSMNYYELLNTAEFQP